MRIEPEIGGVAVVLLGSFNPAIFSPQWFARREIVSEEEADEAEIGVIHPEVVMFRLGSKNIHIEQSRFQIESSEAPWVSVLDFVTKTFGELLVYTPVSAFGVTRNVHFKLKSPSAAHRLGRKLAPIEPWGEWGKEIAAKSKETQSGIVDINMRELWKSDGFSGYTQATVQPSNILQGTSGIYMRVLDHNGLDKVEDGEGAERVISLLNDKFDSIIQKADWIIDQIMGLGEEVA